MSICFEEQLEIHLEGYTFILLEEIVLVNNQLFMLVYIQIVQVAALINFKWNFTSKILLLKYFKSLIQIVGSSIDYFIA